MIDLSVYQKYLLTAYFVGIIVQVLALYVLSQIYCDELSFAYSFALMYVIFAVLQFILFMKMIDEK